MGSALEAAVANDGTTYQCSATKTPIANCFIQTIYSGNQICSVCKTNTIQAYNDLSTCAAFTSTLHPNCVKWMRDSSNNAQCVACNSGYYLASDGKCYTYSANNCLLFGRWNLSMAATCLYCVNGYYKGSDNVCYKQP